VDCATTAAGTDLIIISDNKKPAQHALKLRSGPVFAHGTTGAKRTVGAPHPLHRYIKICKKKMLSFAIL
jgi:hypothetical protein